MKETPIPVIKDTWIIALNVWWAYAWRVLLSLVFGAAFIIAANKYLPAYLHIKKSLLLAYSCAIGPAYAVFITILFMKGMLNKRFKGFSIALIKTK